MGAYLCLLYLLKNKKRIMKKILRVTRKILLASLFVVLVLYLIFNTYVFLNRKDDRLMDDSHLIPVMLNVSNKQNAYPELKEAMEVMYYPEEKKDLILNMITENNWDGELVREIVANNQNIYKLIDDAVQKEYLVLPAVNNLQPSELSMKAVSGSLPDVSELRKLNRILLLGAKNDFDNNNFNDGVQKIINSLSISYKLRNKNNATIPTYIISTGLNKSTGRVIESLSNEGKLNREDGLKLQNELKKVENNSAVINSMKFEYLIMKNAVLDFKYQSFVDNYNLGQSEIINKRLGSSFYFKPNQTINLYNKLFTSEINKYSSIDCRENGDSAYKRYIQNNNPIILLFKENAVGKFLVDLYATSTNIRNVVCDDFANSVKLQLLIALNAYKKDIGKNSKSLEMLHNEGYLISDIDDLRLSKVGLFYDKENGKIVSNK